MTLDIHVDETTLQTMKKDDIHLKLSHSHFEKREIFVESLNEASNLSKSGTTKRKKPRLRSIQISGCSHYDINGRYLECGDMNNAIKYRNVNGWYVFRHVMQEIPELGIYADNCYLATSKEKSIMNDMDLRAGTVQMNLRLAMIFDCVLFAVLCCMVWLDVNIDICIFYCRGNCESNNRSKFNH